MMPNLIGNAVIVHSTTIHQRYEIITIRRRQTSIPLTFTISPPLFLFSRDCPAVSLSSNYLRLIRSPIPAVSADGVKV